MNYHLSKYKNFNKITRSKQKDLKPKVTNFQKMRALIEYQNRITWIKTK